MLAGHDTIDSTLSPCLQALAFLLQKGFTSLPWDKEKQASEGSAHNGMIPVPQGDRSSEQQLVHPRHIQIHIRK